MSTLSEDGPSLAQLSDQLHAKLRAIQENPTIRAAREDRVTKDEVTALRHDVSLLTITMESLKAEVEKISNFVGKLEPPPIPPEKQLEATRRAFKKCKIHITGSRKVDITVVDMLLHLNGLALDGSSSDRRIRLRNAITSGDAQYPEAEVAEEAWPEAQAEAEPDTFTV